MNLPSYLQRIAYKGSVQTSLATLQSLQAAHLFHIPFENLDIHYNRRIKLEIPAIYDKIVLQKRGGFCYELNGLFYELLTRLGFKVKRISARVYNGKDYGQEYDHMALLVEINHMEYLSDVGFGAFTLAPLKMDLDQVQNDDTGDYVIEKYKDSYFQVCKKVKNESIPEYIFQTTPRAFSEFKDMSHFHQTSSLSHFSKKKLISRPTENGRITLTEFELKIKEGSRITKRLIENEEAFDLALWEYFKIKM